MDRLSSLDEQDQLGILELRPNVASSWAAARTVRSGTVERPGDPAFFGRGRVVTGDFDNDGVSDVAFSTYPLLESSLPGRYPHTFSAWPSRDARGRLATTRFA